MKKILQISAALLGIGLCAGYAVDGGGPCSKVTSIETSLQFGSCAGSGAPCSYDAYDIPCQSCKDVFFYPENGCITGDPYTVYVTPKMWGNCNNGICVQGITDPDRPAYTLTCHWVQSAY